MLVGEDSAIDNNFSREKTMDEFDELAGRIDAIGQAVLWLAASLEMNGIIDGPRLCQAWRSRQAPVGAGPTTSAAAVRTLQQMADELDAARSWRQSQAGQATGQTRQPTGAA